MHAVDGEHCRRLRSTAHSGCVGPRRRAPARGGSPHDEPLTESHERTVCANVQYPGFIYYSRETRLHSLAATEQNPQTILAPCRRGRRRRSCPRPARATSRRRRATTLARRRWACAWCCDARRDVTSAGLGLRCCSAAGGAAHGGRVACQQADRVGARRDDVVGADVDCVRDAAPLGGGVMLGCAGGGRGARPVGGGRPASGALDGRRGS